MKQLPPETKIASITYYRKWWQLWKPKQWDEAVPIEYPCVIDCEGKSLDEIYDETKKEINDA